MPFRNSLRPAPSAWLALLSGALLLGVARPADSTPESARPESARPSQDSTKPAGESAVDETAIVTNSPPNGSASRATNAPVLPALSERSSSSNAVTAPDFPSFKILADRNIFNAERTKRSSRPGPGTERPKPASVTTISLVGFLGSAQGDRAFFDGSSSSYRKALKAGEANGDLKLKSLCADNAVVEIGGKSFTLHVGEQLRREEEGPWSVSGGKSIPGRSDGEKSDTSGEATSTEAAATPSTGDADTDSALQRLLKRRQQEESK